MNMRMLQNCMLITLAPVVSMILAYILGEYLILQLCVVALGAAVQIAVLHYVRHDMKKLTHPSKELLDAMEFPGIPAAYEPERLKWDVRISSVVGWLSAAAPLFMLAATRLPMESAASGLPLGGKLALIGILLLVISNLSLMFWVKADQAAYVFKQGSDQKRYRLMGFAQEIDKPGSYARYVRYLHPEKGTRPVIRPRYELN